MNQNAPMQILVIDDDKDISEFINDAAQSIGVSCIATTNVKDFLAALNPKINLLMVDLMMPDIDGIELLRILGQQQCKCNIVLMSGVDRRVLETAENLTKSLGLTVVGILQKPFRLAELEDILLAHVKKPVSSDIYLSTPTTITDQTTSAITKSELQLGIEREEFVIYYQPQIEIATGRLAGMEVLVRWQHPERGLILPDDFISLAEGFGLIDQLGWLVVKRSLNESKKFVNADGRRLTLSINVSPFSLHDLQFPDTLMELVKQSSVEPENITLEITESSLFKELTSALDILTRLRMKKFKLAIDDFGTGYAMMQQLQNVPATELKMDKSLMHAMPMQDSASIMIKKIIEMGHALDMRIVAEGVDIAEQLEFLRSNNCDLAQGYFFSPPLPMSEMLAWIDHFNKLAR